MLQGDFIHHQEPGGAFFPDPYRKAEITAYFINIDLEYDYHITADFAGTAHDDLFYPK